MRLLQPLTLLAATLAPLAAAASSSGHAQVFLFPTPPNAGSQAAPTLSGEQADAVLKHHLGIDISEHNTPPQEGMWAHLLSLWDGGKRPRVVLVEAATAQEVLPSSFQEPAFYLEDNTDVLQPYFDSAREALERVEELPLVKSLLDTLDMATSRAGQLLSKELASLIALADSLWTSANGAWDAVAIRLGVADDDVALRGTATKGLKAGLASMTQPDSPPLIVILVPEFESQKVFTHYKRAFDLPPVVAAAKKGNSTETRIDVSAPLAVIVGSSVFMLLAVVGGVMLLFSVGETALPSTLTLAVGGPKHRD